MGRGFTQINADEDRFSRYESFTCVSRVGHAASLFAEHIHLIAGKLSVRSTG